MNSLEEAKALAEMMVYIAQLTDRKAIALLSDMNQPLGNAVGNALEVIEAIDTLHGGGPEDLRQHCLEVASHMLVLGELAVDERVGRQLAEKAIMSGESLERFRTLVRTQSGDVSYIDCPDKFPKAPLIQTLNAPRFGYLKGINARIVGEVSVRLGAGRMIKEDIIDHAVGIIVHHKVGDFVDAGQPLFTIHANRTTVLEEAERDLLTALEWSDVPVRPLPLFYGVIKSTDLEMAG